MAATINPSRICPIRILAVNFPALFQEAIFALLEHQAGVTILPRFAACRTVLSTIASSHSEPPDLLLFDLDNCPHQRLECLVPLRSSAPAIRILGLAGVFDITLFRTAICQGARGVILKTDSTATLLEAIQQAHRGQIWLGHEVAAQLVSESWLVSPPQPDKETFSRISKREREVLALLGGGGNDQQIADRLGISVATVRSHLTSVRLKLEVKCRTDLVVYYRRQGLTEATLPASNDWAILRKARLQEA